MERRDFLKISALTTGAVLTINPLSALAETMVSEETGMAESRPEGGFHHTRRQFLFYNSRTMGQCRCRICKRTSGSNDDAHPFLHT